MKIKQTDDTLILTEGAWWNLIPYVVLIVLGCLALVFGVGWEWLPIGIILIGVGIVGMWFAVTIHRWTFNRTAGTVKIERITLRHAQRDTYPLKSIRRVEAGCYPEKAYLKNIFERVENPITQQRESSLDYADDANVVCHLQLVLRSGVEIPFGAVSPSEARDAKAHIDTFIASDEAQL